MMANHTNRNKRRLDLFVATLAIQVGMWDEEDATNWMMSGFNGESRTDPTKILEHVMMFKSTRPASASTGDNAHGDDAGVADGSEVD